MRRALPHGRAVLCRCLAMAIVSALQLLAFKCIYYCALCYAIVLRAKVYETYVIEATYTEAIGSKHWNNTALPKLLRVG